MKQGMYNIAAFPNVIGAVDGSMFSIQKPLVNSNAYLCRKKYYAINGMFVCDNKMRFTLISVK